MPQLDYAVFDADNHLYETEDALTRHLPAAHANLFRFVEINGRKKLVVRNVLTEFIPNPTFEVVAQPGSHMSFYAGENSDGRTLRELTGKPIRCEPAFREPQARLELLDEAIAELELLIDRGARAVLMRPAPVSGLRGTRSPFLPEFDPFWARVQEAGLVVALHASDSGYQDYLNTWEGTGGEYVAFRPQTFAAVADGGRTIQDALASAICHGMLTRFPGVKLISVENGGSWVGTLLGNLLAAYKKMPQEFPEHPLDVFHRNVWVNPFWEDSVTGLIELIGADRVCFGSDYPHPEGLEDPLSWAGELHDTPPPDIERIMSTNMFELLGLDRPSVGTRRSA